MRFFAKLKKEGSRTLAEFPDCKGCQTFAEEGKDIEGAAREALEGWLEAELLAGRTAPAAKAAGKRGGIWVSVPAQLAVKLALRAARQRAGMTQAELARRAGLTQPAVARLEHPDWNPTLETLDKVARALGVELRVEFAPGQ